MKDIEELVIEMKDSETAPYNIPSESCVDMIPLDSKYQRYNIKNYDEFTNCPDGKLHKWKYDNDNLICSKCNADFNKLYNKYNNTTSEKDDSKLLENVRYNYIKNLTKSYCIDGNVHDIDDSGKCKKCKLNQSTHKYTNSELDRLENNLKKKQINDSIEYIKNEKEKLKQIKKKKDNINKILMKFEKRYYVNTKMNLRNYVSDFIDRLEKKSGGKIKYGDYEYYLKMNKFIINNDYSGKMLPKPIEITSDHDYKMFNKKLQQGICKYYHPKVEKLVYVYFNKGNQTYYFYDCNTLLFIGSSENSKDIRYATNRAHLVIIPSIKEKILSLGYENDFINLYDYDSSIIEKDNKTILKMIDEKPLFFKNIIDRRINNLKQIINKVNEIIEKINNSMKVKPDIFNSQQLKLINEFNKLIKEIELTDLDGSNSVFKHKDYIVNNISNNNITPLPKENVYFNPAPIFDMTIMENMNSIDSKLIFFIIYNFNRLLEYNSKNSQISIINYLIVRLVDMNYQQYYVDINRTDIKRFISYIYRDQPYMDENLRVVGVYNELVDENEEVSEEVRNNIMDNMEADDALDIDDYESDDPEAEGYMESLDNSAN